MTMSCIFLTYLWLLYYCLMLSFLPSMLLSHHAFSVQFCFICCLFSAMKLFSFVTAVFYFCICHHLHNWSSSISLWRISSCNNALLSISWWLLKSEILITTVSIIVDLDFERVHPIEIGSCRAVERSDNFLQAMGTWKGSCSRLLVKC